MGRTISISRVPKWILQPLVAGWVVVLALYGAVVVLGAFAPGIEVGDFQSPLALFLLAVLWVGLTALWVLRARQRDGGERGDSWWGPVPSWQYGGRFAEVGGLARDSWEKALPDDRDDVYAPHEGRDEFE